MKSCNRRTVLRWGALSTLACNIPMHSLLAGMNHGLRAGASVVDVSPRALPIITSGMWTEHLAQKVNDPLHARCLVLDDGTTTIALVVVDSLMLSRELLDTAKEAASSATGIPTEHMLISATHTHAAPPVVGVLGTDVDDQYARQLQDGIVESIVHAFENRTRAKVGWAAADAREHTHCRRWIHRPDRIAADPFGALTVRANMIPGYQDPDRIGPAGPCDSGLSLLAVQSLDGRPIAVLANYSMHYFEWKPVSADYFGLFCEKLARRIGDQEHVSPPVVILSQGTAGDQQWFDFSQPQRSPSIDDYTEGVAKIAYDAYKTIQFRDDVSLAMAEQRLRLGRRAPNEDRLAWARQIVAGMNGRKPQTLPEIYAREQIYLDQQPQSELKLQAVRIGDLGIAAIPCEAFGITGLKLKSQSPLQSVFTVGLANGAEGYIPPPEQHKLGGYTTWPARSAGLEVSAEPKIVEATLKLLEDVSGMPRRPVTLPQGPYSIAVSASKPLAYWRLCDFEGPYAADASGNENRGSYEDGVVFYLDGPPLALSGSEHNGPRAAHFAGGRMHASLGDLADAYSIELWFWNGMPNDARVVTGFLFSRNCEASDGSADDRLAIGGAEGAAGRLVFVAGTSASPQRFEGKNVISPRTWNHVIAVRSREMVRVYLNGNEDPEIAAPLDIACPAGTARIFLGGDRENSANFEGRIAEASYYNRVLTPAEISDADRNPPIHERTP